MAKIRICIMLVAMYSLFCPGCKEKAQEKETAEKEIGVSSKFTESEAVAIARNALKDATLEEIANKYQIHSAEWSDGAWRVLFVGDPLVDGDECLVLVYEDKRTRVAPGW